MTGIRWKCLVCSDFDLCNACYFSGAHPAEHKMLRLETSDDAADLKDTVSSNELRVCFIF